MAYDPIAPNGIRHNRGFESAALTTDETGIYTAAEEGLSQDELPGGSAALTRILRYGLPNGVATAEYGYLLDTLPLQAQNGIAAMLSIGPDRLLVLERALTLVGFSIRLYDVDLGGADDILGDMEIATEYLLGNIQIADKTLVRNLSAAAPSGDGLNVSNIEGRAFGPWDGLARTMLLISDDGDPITNNDLYADRVTFDKRFGVPLPPTLPLLLAGLAGLIGALRRVKRPLPGV